MINSKQVRIRRHPKDILSKIQHLEKTFKDASDWINNTGQGVANEEQFDAYVKKLCPYYDDLKPIMEDITGSRPRADTDQIFDGENKSLEDNAASTAHGKEDSTPDSSDAEEVKPPGTILFPSPTPTTRTMLGRGIASRSTASQSVASQSVASQSIASQSRASRSKAGNTVKSGPPRKKDWTADYLSMLMSNQAEVVKDTATHHKMANKETARHNRLMEKLEEDKVRIAQQQEKRLEKTAELEARVKELEIKAKELEYKTLQFRHFKTLKRNMTDAGLIAEFPEMRGFISAYKKGKTGEESTDDEAN